MPPILGKNRILGPPPHTHTQRAMELGFGKLGCCGLM